MFDARAQAVLDRYNERMAREEAEMRRLDIQAALAQRDGMLLAVGEEVARFLHALAVARGARRILEIGTSYGYSTLFLAQAARDTGGTLVTIELGADKQAFARAQLAEAGLDDVVEWVNGDAPAAIDRVEGPLDLVLIDLWKELYVPCLHAVYPKLAPEAVIVGDNMIYPPIARPEARAYRAAVAALPGMQTVLLPIGSGIEVSCLWPADSDKL